MYRFYFCNSDNFWLKKNKLIAANVTLSFYFIFKPPAMIKYSIYLDITYLQDRDDDIRQRISVNFQDNGTGFCKNKTTFKLKIQD